MRNLKKHLSSVQPAFVKWIPLLRYFPHLEWSVLEVRDIASLKKANDWIKDPIINDTEILKYEYLEDLNDRRMRDAEVIGTVCCNLNPKILLEIGTSYGHSTALMAENALQGVVYTINLPPDQLNNSGNLITFLPRYEDIGHYYREKGLINIKQIFVNTANWEPSFGPIDVAFIDGCHDAKFVFNDTRKVLSACQPGSIILWHDFALNTMAVYPWTAEVARGIERLYQKKYISGKILHVQDSWIGIYIVNERDISRRGKG